MITVRIFQPPSYKYLVCSKFKLDGPISRFQNLNTIELTMDFQVWTQKDNSIFNPRHVGRWGTLLRFVEIAEICIVHYKLMSSLTESRHLLNSKLNRKSTFSILYMSAQLLPMAEDGRQSRSHRVQWTTTERRSVHTHTYISKHY